MSDMNSNKVIEVLKPLLKANGFKKTASTWRRAREGSTEVFNIQKSQWDNNNFYVNVGVYFFDFGSNTSPAESACHIRSRLVFISSEELIVSALNWFDNRNTLTKVHGLSQENAKKDLIHKVLRNG